LEALLIRLKYIISSIGHWLHKRLSFIVLPGFDGMPLYDVLVFFVRGLFRGVLTYRAAAIAFNFFLALVPFILFLFTLIPFVTTENYQADMLDLMSELIPLEIYKMAEGTIVEIVSRASTGLLSLVFFMAIYFATNGVDAILEGFGQSYHAGDIWPWWKQKVTAFVLMTSLSFLIFMSMAFLGFGKLAISILKQQDIITNQVTIFWLATIRWIIIVVFLLISISVLYYFGQPKDKKQNKYRFFSPGSILATTLFVGGGILIKLYFENFARYNLLYGSIGSIIILMVWLYYNAIILLIGYELNASIRQSKSEQTRYRVIE
jgi:membrane protein